MIVSQNKYEIQMIVKFPGHSTVVPYRHIQFMSEKARLCRIMRNVSDPVWHYDDRDSNKAVAK